MSLRAQRSNLAPATLHPTRACRLPLALWSLEQGAGAVFDAALDRPGEQVQQARQAELDRDAIVQGLDAAGDRLHHRDDPEIEPVILPGVIERFDVRRDLAADRGEALVDPALGLLAPEAVRDRDGDRLCRGQHIRETPGLPAPLPPGLMRRRDGSDKGGSRMAETTVKSEIAGSVWKIEVVVGDAVAAEDPLISLESMKMEIPLLAPRAGVVRRILVAEGEPIAEGDVAVILG